MPDDFDIMATEGDFSFGILHQRFGRARVYLFFGLSGQHRFSGPGARACFTEACRFACVPWGEQIARAVPIGPCATFPGDDTWTPHPYAEGIVLIGDAAGHNDPIAAQGLSIALRDARLVRDLILAEARQPSDFTPYGTERSERMERLRLVADVLSVAKAEDADNRSARRAYFDELVAAGILPRYPFCYVVSSPAARRYLPNSCEPRSSNAFAVPKELPEVSGTASTTYAVFRSRPGWSVAQPDVRGKLWGNASFNMAVPASTPLIEKEAPPRAPTVSPAQGRSPPSFPAPTRAVNGRKGTRIEDGALRA